MKKILVGYTTNAGSTVEVAQTVADSLKGEGIQVDAARLEEIQSVEGYDAVVVGAPMILGWHRSATKFLKKHQQALSQKKVAYFFTAMSLTETGEGNVDGVPVLVDEELTTAPNNPQRLTYRERYATVSNYLRPVLKAAPLVKPLTAGFFGGKLEMFRLVWYQALFVMLIIQAKPGDRRNWPVIKGWAENLKQVLI